MWTASLSSQVEVEVSPPYSQKGLSRDLSSQFWQRVSGIWLSHLQCWGYCCESLNPVFTWAPGIQMQKLMLSHKDFPHWAISQSLKFIFLEREHSHRSFTRRDVWSDLCCRVVLLDQETKSMKAMTVVSLDDVDALGTEKEGAEWQVLGFRLDFERIQHVEGLLRPQISAKKRKVKGDREDLGLWVKVLLTGVLKNHSALQRRKEGSCATEFSRRLMGVLMQGEWLPAQIKSNIYEETENHYDYFS